MERKNNRVYALYRVSTLGQVEKDDIPMQKQACQEFAQNQGWQIIKEYAEKGVSGYKVSAKDRDAIQDIQKSAMDGKFDILLVFMFDRLGRREDETPFVVEWFVNNGIEVWSAREGQQRFDTHVDKLTNYIRFWQASGESIKTAIRTKTRLGQLTQEGRFCGGTAPFGYRLEKQGRINKRNHEVYDIVIDEAESEVVRKIFDLYLVRGYGSQRITSYLRDHEMNNRSGSDFTNTTIQHMLKNISYTGVLKSGDIHSEIFSHLQIIDVRTFEKVQEMIKMRSNEYNEARRIPLNTKGMVLLSGNVFCGHCGARLVTTTNGKEYVDGVATPKIRYVCYNRSRHPGICNGQTGYTSKILDRLIEQIIMNIFDQLKEQPKEAMVKAKYASSLEEQEKQLSKAKKALNNSLKEQGEYEAEVINIIRGTSQLSSELVNKLHADATFAVAQNKALVVQCEEELERCRSGYSNFQHDIDEMLSWANIFSISSIEEKKMIASNLISCVRVSKNYKLEVTLNISCGQMDVAVSTEVANASVYWI